MTSGGVVAALSVAAVTWFLVVEALHCGVAATALRANRRDGPAPWRLLGPLVLVNEVWLVVALVLPATALGGTVHRAWDRAWPLLLAAVVLSATQFALLMLAPVVRREELVRRVLVGTGIALPPVWALALGLGGGAHPLLAAGAGAVGLAASLVVGSAFADLVNPGDIAHRSAGLRLGLGAGAVVLLVAAAVTAGAPGLLDVDGDTATLQVVAVAALVMLPLLLTLQVAAWRLTLSAWQAGRPLEPVHARPLAPSGGGQ